MSSNEDRETVVDMGGKEQGIVVFDGSGAPLVLVDSMKQDEIAEYLTEPVARRVLIARLRAWLEMVEAIDAEDHGFSMGPIPSEFLSVHNA